MDSIPHQIPGSTYRATSSGDIISPSGAKLTPWRGDRGGHLRVDTDLGRMYVHQLVALAFIGTCPDGQEVRHLNGAHGDNRIENLAYGTRSENVIDSVGHGTYRNANGEKTHCPRGHAYDFVNTYVDPSGRRRCRKCRRVA